MFDFFCNASEGLFTLELWDGSTLLQEVVTGETTQLPLQDYQLRIVPNEAAGAEILDITTDPVFNSSPFGDPTWKENTTEGYFYQNYNDGNLTSSSTYTLTVSATGEVIETVYPANRVHLMTPENIETLNTKDLYTIVTGGTESIEIARGEYIINLLALPFEVNSSNVVADLPIKLGSYDTTIVTPLLGSDSLEVNAGEIIVSGEGSVLDYEQVEYDLFLPFINDVISLAPTEVVGKTITVEMIIDVYTGDLVLNLYNGGSIPFKTEKSAIGREIPIRNRKEKLIGSFGQINGVDNKTLKAYIRKRQPEIVTGSENNLVYKTGSLSGLNGYVEVDSIQLDFNAINNEKELILNELKQGVYIK